MQDIKNMPTAAATGPTLQSQDVLAGLGAAPRELLATCLSLFEDSTLQRRLSEHVEAIADTLRKPGARLEDGMSSLQRGITAWMRSPSSDEELRLMLWVALREALALPPSTFGSLRSTRTAADDLVAATLALLGPGMLEKVRATLGWGGERQVHMTLDTLARQTVQELVNGLLNAKDDASAEARDALLQRAKKQVAQLDPEAQDRLLQAINARELNDDAIRTLLLTGGGLAAFGGAVSLAGFSAYILAAQASALIPILSGPTLVSMVAVLSNPITIGLGTLGVGYWVTRSANAKIQAAIAIRVTALLALCGLSAGDAGLRKVVRMFPLLQQLRPAGVLNAKALDAYRTDWARIAPAYRRARSLDAPLAKAVDQYPPGKTLPDRWRQLLGSEALQDMGAMSLLTVGELLYQMQGIDPRVLAAADFSRVEDLGDPVAFAAFAHRIDGMDAASRLGADSNLQGYVAERMVAARLVEQGHVVDFPASSNQAGWDLSVDGVKFQVKNASDLGLLNRHFDQGHDYPVLANAEVADLLAKAKDAGDLPDWASQVHFVEGYSSQSVHDVSAASLDAGDGMLHPHVPVFAVAVNAIRQLTRYQQGQVTGTQAVQEVFVSGTIGAGLAVAGNYVGIGIGLLVFGPAGGLVLGAALPILSRTQVSRAKALTERTLRGNAYRAWENATRASLHTLLETANGALGAKEALIMARAAKYRDSAAETYIGWRLDDDLGFLRESRLRLEYIRSDASADIEDLSARTVHWLATCGLHPVHYQPQFQGLLEALSKRPTLGDSVGEKVGGTVEAVNRIKDSIVGWIKHR